MHQDLKWQELNLAGLTGQTLQPGDRLLPLAARSHGYHKRSNDAKDCCNLKHRQSSRRLQPELADEILGGSARTFSALDICRALPSLHQAAQPNARQSGMPSADRKHKQAIAILTGRLALLAEETPSDELAQGFNAVSKLGGLASSPDLEHMGTCLHRRINECGAFAIVNTAEGCSRSLGQAQNLQPLLSATAERALGAMHLLGQKQIRRLVKAFATAGSEFSHVVDGAADQVLSHGLTHLTAEELAHTLHVFVSAPGTGRRVLQAALPSLLDKAPVLGTSDIALISWSVAKCCGSPCQSEYQHLLDALSNRAMQLISRFSAKDISMTAYAFATAGHCSPGLQLALAGEGFKKLRRFSPQGLSLMVWSLAKCDVYHEAVLYRTASVAADNLQALGPLHITNLFWAYASLAHASDRFTSALSVAVMHRLSEFDPQHLALIAWSSATLMCPKSPELVEGIGRYMLNNVSFFSPSDISRVTWALAVVERLDSNLLQLIVGTSCHFDSAAQPSWGSIDLLNMFQSSMAVVPCQHEGSRSDSTLASVSSQSMGLPHWMISQARECWRESASKTRPSRLQKEVASACTRASYEVSTEALVADGLFCVDVLIRLNDGDTVLLEVDGPSHYTRSKPHRMLGAALLRHRLLSHQGRVINVAFWDWDALRGDISRQVSLVKRLIGPAASRSVKEAPAS